MDCFQPRHYGYHSTDGINTHALKKKTPKKQLKSTESSYATVLDSLVDQLCFCMIRSYFNTILITFKILQNNHNFQKPLSITKTHFSNRYIPDYIKQISVRLVLVNLRYCN